MAFYCYNIALIPFTNIIYDKGVKLVLQVNKRKMIKHTLNKRN